MFIWVRTEVPGTSMVCLSFRTPILHVGGRIFVSPKSGVGGSLLPNRMLRKPGDLFLNATMAKPFGRWPPRNLDCSTTNGRGLRSKFERRNLGEKSEQ
jgi:hypothetical protein